MQSGYSTSSSFQQWSNISKNRYLPFLSHDISHYLTFYFLNIGHETGVWASPVFSVIILVYLLTNYLLHHLRSVQAVCHQLESNPARSIKEQSESRLSPQSGENPSPFMSVKQGSHVKIFIIFAKRIVERLSDSQPAKYKEEFECDEEGKYHIDLLVPRLPPDDPLVRQEGD